MDETTLNRVIVAQNAVLRELRAHLVVVKRVLTDNHLISDDHYDSLLDSARAGFDEMDATQHQEIEELRRIADLEKPESPED